MAAKKFNFRKKASVKAGSVTVSENAVSSSVIEDSVNSIDSDLEDFQFLLTSERRENGDTNEAAAVEALTVAMTANSSSSWSFSSTKSDSENIPQSTAIAAASATSAFPVEGHNSDSNELLILEEKVTKVTNTGNLNAWMGIQKRVNEEKKVEAKNAWKGLMGTMQKNQSTVAATSRTTAKRQIKTKTVITETKIAAKKIKTDTKTPTPPTVKVKSVGLTEVRTAIIIDDEEEKPAKGKTSMSPPKAICPIFLKSKSKVASQDSEDLDESIKPWDMAHTENPWDCGPEADVGLPEEVSLNINTVVEPDVEEKRSKKKCPFYKFMPDTRMSVDAFDYGVLPGVDVYLLSHFHADHYGGLTKKFNKTILCSRPTGNLVQIKLGVAAECIRKLELNRVYTIQGVEIVLVDANHCPGSVMFILRLPNGKLYLHTGDFRYTPEMLANRYMQKLRIDILYLDTTYCDPQYTFPRQSESISNAIEVIKKHLAYRPKTLIVCGTYCIGKERVFCAVADAIGSKVYCQYHKRQVILATENNYIIKLLSHKEEGCQVHVMPMMKLNPKSLSEYLQERSAEYTNILAVKPTGWEFSKGPGCSTTGSKMRSHHNNTVHVLGVPYSEHSSFAELREFIIAMKPVKVQPTVNVGNPKKRTAIMEHVNKWMSE